MEKALIFNHNLPYDVNVHIVAEDTITLVPRFESEQVKDLYIDFHLQGYTNSKLGLAKWKTDLENMPARSLIYKNAKEITFTIDIVNYNEDVLNRNFVVTKTETGEYKFWWIKKITRIGQLKSTLYNVYLTLDYWWTYGIDSLFDNDKQVLIKRAHVINYARVEYPKGSGNYYYRELNDIWSNPYINSGEDFKPKESNYIMDSYEILNKPWVIDERGIETHSDRFFQKLSEGIHTVLGIPIPVAELTEMLTYTALDLFFYWSNSIDSPENYPKRDCLNLSGDIDRDVNQNYIMAMSSLFLYKMNPDPLDHWSVKFKKWVSPNIFTTDDPGAYTWAEPFSLIIDPQKIVGTSTRLGINAPWYAITEGKIVQLDVNNSSQMELFINTHFQATEGNRLWIKEFNNYLELYGFGQGEANKKSYWDQVLMLALAVQSDVAPLNTWAINDYFRCDQFFKHFEYTKYIIKQTDFDISKPRTLYEVKINNDPYTKYRVIMPSTNQFDIMNQYVNNKYSLGFKYTNSLDPGQPSVIIIPVQYVTNNGTDYIYGKSTNYNLSLDDNTNFTWPDSTNEYDQYMLRNKSFLHQNQVDKYVHGGFKLGEDTMDMWGKLLHLNIGGFMKGGVKVAEDAYSEAQVALDYNAKMDDLKRTPGKWQSKSNNLMNLNTYKLPVPIMYKLTLYEPLWTNLNQLFIAHGYTIGGYQNINNFIRGEHQRYFFNYIQAVNVLNIISKELSLQIKMAIQADLKIGIQIRHIRKSMLNANGSWKYMNKFNDYTVNNVEYHLAFVPHESN